MGRDNPDDAGPGGVVPEQEHVVGHGDAGARWPSLDDPDTSTVVVFGEGACRAAEAHEYGYDLDDPELTRCRADAFPLSGYRFDSVADTIRAVTLYPDRLLDPWPVRLWRRLFNF